MKNTKRLIGLMLVLVMVVSALAVFAACDPCKDGHDFVDGVCTRCGEKESGGETPNPLAGTYNITMWVSEKTGVAELFQAQIDAFEAANPGITINATIEGVTEADAASKVAADVATAPDIYCFAQDQLARLVQAAALVAPGDNATATIKANNDTGSVSAASVNDKVWCYPLTSDNGYYMYYDTSILSETDVESLETIIEKCEAAGKKIRFALENAWYTASFFFATGCESTWSYDAKGYFSGVNDTFSGPNGLIAMKGMQKLAQSEVYDSNADIFDDAAVVVTGTWNTEAAENHFGDSLGATDLPSFTVDGESYHLGSYSGNKLLGVKPQQDVKRTAVLQQLALFLTGKDMQLSLFKSQGWGPSNKEAQASKEVKASVSLTALAKQSAYAVPQGNIHGDWWDVAKVLGADAKAATSDADLETALANYKTAMEGIAALTENVTTAWVVDLAEDIAMTKKTAKTWLANVSLADGDELVLRRGDGKVIGGATTGGTFVLEDGVALVCSATVAVGEYTTDGKLVVCTPGTYNITLTYDGTADPTLSFESTSWGVVGTINNWGATPDILMTKEGNVYTSAQFEVVGDAEIKVRYASDWNTTNFGGTLDANLVCEAATKGGSNFKIAEAGTYYVVMTWDGKSETAKIEVIKVVE